MVCGMMLLLHHTTYNDILPVGKCTFQISLEMSSFIFLWGQVTPLETTNGTLVNWLSPPVAAKAIYGLPSGMVGTW